MVATKCELRRIYCIITHNHNAIFTTYSVNADSHVARRSCFLKLKKTSRVSLCNCCDGMVINSKQSWLLKYDSTRTLIYYCSVHIDGKIRYVTIDVVSNIKKLPEVEFEINHFIVCANSTWFKNVIPLTCAYKLPCAHYVIKTHIYIDIF